MLRHLRVTNFAILSDVSVELSLGMNVLTGETGAGKSLIVEAVNLLRGGRASADIPRKGAKEAVVEAVFEVPDDLAPSVAALLSSAGLPDDDGEVLVRRVIHKGGRSRTYINGALTTARQLADIGAILVDLSGQHQHQGLVDPARHRAILDSFAEQEPLVDEMHQAWHDLRAMQRERDTLGGDERARAERVDYLRFQLEELEEAALEPGEDDALDAERARLESVDRLEGAARTADELCYSGDDSAVDRVAAALRDLDRVVAIDDRLSDPVRQLEEARALIEDATGALRRYADGLEGDPARLAWVDDRLALIKRLARKHGGSLADVIARVGELRSELDGLVGADDRLDELERQIASADKAARAIAAKLSRARKAAGRALCKEVGQRLVELGMVGSELTCVVESRDLGADGADHVELLLCSNKGEEAKPLARIASGGELSRIMLALKLVLRTADGVATYVFDEVDTGVGGATAEVVGRQIRSLAGERQVLCVTHLPQIAVFADTHLQVTKHEVDGRVETEVSRLSDTERRDETARMLGGTLTTRARAHATEMLRAARG